MMGRRCFLRRLSSLSGIGIIGVSSLSLVACATNRSDAEESLQVPKTMILESSAFPPDGAIPAKYTCDGDNVSPALTWDAPPEKTLSLVLIADDPDAPRRTYVHWVLYDLDPKIRELPEGVPSQPILNLGGVQGKNDFGRYGYGGPCPPNGTHRYFFKLYALDTVLDLPPGATKAEVIKAMKEHILAGAELIGRYSR
ncbi:MAG: YbhB/YbcL family Raf kinase inhibitor-like protein [Cyanobacteria bacterium CRU_2_1]|nr:YbhB/YbcL family Raf kinase inhibitor-like protein [Cyanobacteria bacterium RU_5_0]NJR62614.1 YbhB/YbcL family Raf kinase inhibitor-like protein [Cyanobacteria bacterium CRU_2_1]